MSAVARRYFVRAREQLRVGDSDGASRSFGAALELCPSFVEARIGYALGLLPSDAPRAAQILRAGVSRTVRARARAQLQCALGDVLVSSGDFRGAEAAYTEASQFPGVAVGLFSRLARLRAKTGQFKEAFDAMLEASRAGR